MLASIDFQTTQERQHYSSPGDSHLPFVWPETLNHSRQSNPHFARTCMQNNQMFAFARGYFWGIRPIIRKPHIICAVILVDPCFIQVHDIIPFFPKRFDLSQIITPIIDNRHLVVQNSWIITYFFL